MGHTLRDLSFEEARDARDGRTQAFFRGLNERIAELQRSRMFIEFACECNDRGCTAPVVLSIDEYEAVRRNPVRFVVVHDHVLPAIEDVVFANDRYTVVEKRGLAAEAVASLADRAARADRPTA
jgi:hypothetical protein